MFNLLPENAKNKIRRSYQRRRLQLALFFLLAITVLALIMLVPSFVAVIYKQREIKTEKDTLQVANIIDQDAKSVLALAQNKVLALAEPEDLKTHELFDLVISYKNSAIKIRDLNYTLTSAGEPTLKVSGVAANREALLSFVRQLETDPSFAQAVLPVSNFAKESNIDFAIDITLEPKSP